jgi:hypothetical protein
MNNHARFFPPLLTLALSMGAALPAVAQSATGLGQAWPNVPDVSASPHFHVYVFNRAGIRYVQLNDLGGTVRGAYGVADDEAFALPIGVDADRAALPTDPARPGSTASTASEVVYSDDSVKMIVTPQRNGTMQMLLIGNCKDPAECAVHGP